MRKPGSSFPKPAFDYVRAHNEVVSEDRRIHALDRPTVTVDGIAEPSRQVEQVSENFFQRPRRDADRRADACGSRTVRSRSSVTACGAPASAPRPTFLAGRDR